MRERRKERRETAKAAIESLRTLEKEALEFHTSPAFDAVSAEELTYRVNRVIRSLQRAPLSRLDLPVGRMVRLRKAITLNNSSQKTFTVQPSGGTLLTDIRTAT